MRALVLILLLVAGLVEPRAQEVRYVTDALRLEGRSGPSTSHKILLMLDSGTRLTVLEEADGYSRVRPPTGEEVWILSRYLQSAPAARDRLSDATRELDVVREEKTSLAGELLRAQDALRESEGALRVAEVEGQALRQDLAAIKQAAASTLATREENTRLSGRIDAQIAEIDILTKETRALKEGSEREWFIAGAGVLVLGVLLGLILPRLGRGRGRRRGLNDF